MIQDHFDGHGLNDDLAIDCDPRDRLSGGNASHRYTVSLDGETVADIRFQHGPRHVEKSVAGVTNEAIIAVVIDRLRGFQDGPYRCRENAIALTKLEEALHWHQARAHDRARRGVLGKNQE